MPAGPGKYDYLCDLVRATVNAKGAAVMVFDGMLGSGFSIQATPEMTAALPNILRSMADDIELELSKMVVQ